MTLQRHDPERSNKTSPGNPTRSRQTLLAVALLTLTLAAGLGAREATWPWPQDTSGDSKTTGLDFAATGNGPVHFSGTLDRGAVLEGSDGLVKLELVLRGEEGTAKARAGRVPTDLVVVLDRSGSMRDTPLDNAKGAIRELIAQLNATDRFGLVSYASSATLSIPLEHATPDARPRWKWVLDGISAQGGTHMAGGLDLATNLLAAPRRTGRATRVILISDGHANEGDVSVVGLRERARRAVQGEYVLSTAGVGDGFDESLMTALADAGTGNFYYVPRSNELGDVFANEFASARDMVASGLVVHIEPKSDVQVLDAAGYPLERGGGQVSFRPGDLAAGQERRIWVTLRAPTDATGSIDLGGFTLAFTHEGTRRSMGLDPLPQVACVAAEKEFYAAVDGTTWARSVVVDDYNDLKQRVAQDLQSGERDRALSSIRSYSEKKAKQNLHLKRPEVAAQIQDLEGLEEEVESAFSMGAPGRNRMSKDLVAESRDQRRVGSKRETK